MKYRIIEKAITTPIYENKGGTFPTSHTEGYIRSVYIVQEYEFDGAGLQNIQQNSIKNLQEFNTLEVAREYKHKLELKDGIVIK